MNQQSLFLATLINYNVNVRGTLEYCVQKDSYDVNFFNARKRAVLIEVDEPRTPLKSIIDQSGDNGANLEKEIRSFYDEVYGPESTVLKLDGEGKELRVDHAQHEVIYRHVLSIHESVDSMIRSLINQFHTANVNIAELEQLENLEEAIYRGVAYVTLLPDLWRRFNEYQTARREADGKETPASNFIGRDLQTLIGHIGFVRQHAHLTNLTYKGMEDRINVLVENMIGRRDLAVGRTFLDVYRETIETVNAYVRDADKAFIELFPKVMNDLREQAKINAEAQAKAEAEEQKA